MPKPFLSLLSSSSGLLLSIFELPEDPVLGTGLVALISLAELRVRHRCGAGGLVLSRPSLLVSSSAIQRCCQATLVPKSGIGSNPVCSGWLGDWEWWACPPAAAPGCGQTLCRPAGWPGLGHCVCSLGEQPRVAGPVGQGPSFATPTPSPQLTSSCPVLFPGSLSCC